MMNTQKLVSRLREQAATHDGGWSLLRAAADEIERLHAIEIIAQRINVTWAPTAEDWLDLNRALNA